MNGLKVEAATGEVIEISAGDRWQVYMRLRELDIVCKCETNQPLRVRVNNVTEAVQLWSVVKQLNSPRRDLVHWLKLCWKARG